LPTPHCSRPSGLVYDARPIELSVFDALSEQQQLPRIERLAARTVVATQDRGDRRLHRFFNGRLRASYRAALSWPCRHEESDRTQTHQHPTGRFRHELRHVPGGVHVRKFHHLYEVLREEHRIFARLTACKQEAFKRDRSNICLRLIALDLPGPSAGSQRRLQAQSPGGLANPGVRAIRLPALGRRKGGITDLASSDGLGPRTVKLSRRKGDVINPTTARPVAEGLVALPASLRRSSLVPDYRGSAPTLVSHRKQPLRQPA
jgi:hypothetical protein